MVEKVDLKPCPFCGGEGSLYSVSLPMLADCDDIVVRCSDCDAVGPSVLFDQDYHSETDIKSLEAEAIALWNNRRVANC